MCDAKLGDWICDMVRGHEGIHFAPGLGPFQTTNETKQCPETTTSGVQCKLPRDHDGNHYSRLATDENVARCLSPHPDASSVKCHEAMNHKGVHRAKLNDAISKGVSSGWEQA